MLFASPTYRLVDETNKTISKIDTIDALGDGILTMLTTGWQKLCGGTGRPPPKSLDSDENLKPKYKFFLSQIKICRDLRTFWRSLGKKSAFWGQNSVFSARGALLHGIYCIF